jgi:hypothetical protein
VSREQGNNAGYPIPAPRGGVKMLRIRSKDNKISEDTFRKTVLTAVMITYGSKFEFIYGVPIIITTKNPR